MANCKSGNWLLGAAAWISGFFYLPLSASTKICRIRMKCFLKHFFEFPSLGCSSSAKTFCAGSIGDYEAGVNTSSFKDITGKPKMMRISIKCRLSTLPTSHSHSPLRQIQI